MNGDEKLYCQCGGEIVAGLCLQCLASRLEKLENFIFHNYNMSG